MVKSILKDKKPWSVWCRGLGVGGCREDGKANYPQIYKLKSEKGTGAAITVLIEIQDGMPVAASGCREDEKA